MGYIYQPTYNSQQRRAVIDGYVQMVTTRVERGWEPYLLSFMYRHIGAKRERQLAIMGKEIERVYGSVINGTLRYPGTAYNEARRPVWICSPDYPVPKKDKKSYKDVTINDGLHFQVVALQPPWSIMQERLDLFLLARRNAYIRDSYEERQDHPLLRIHADPITNNLECTVEYALKAVLNYGADPSEIFTLPKARREFKNLPEDPRKLTGGGRF